MSRPLKVIPPLRRLTIPGLESRPDLQQQYEREVASTPGCSGCAKAAIRRKYLDRAKPRN